MNLSLGNIQNAEGLDPADQVVLKSLLRVMRTHKARNRRLVDYYKGDVTPPPIGIDTIPESVDIEEHCDWPKKAVEAVAERSRLSGFTFDGGGSDDTLDQIVLNNDLLGAYHRHVHTELIHGCMFATVGRYGEHAIVRFHTAEDGAAIWDDTTGCIGAGLVIADTRTTPWSLTREVPVQVNMHLPGRCVTFLRVESARWIAQSQETPLDRPAMEAFAYRPTGLRPFGQSRITKTVMSLTDDYMRVMRDMAVSSAFYSSPQKYLLGLTNDQYDMLTKNKRRAYLTDMLMATMDQEGRSPTYGQLPGNSPEPYIAMLRTLATLFSGATGVPLNSLGIVQDNPSSAEAITASREDICICAQQLNDSNGRSLRNVALMAMAVEVDGSIESLDERQRSVMVSWLDPSMPSVVSQADAATKIAAVASGFVDSPEFWRMMGFDEVTINQIMAALNTSNAQTLLAAFAARPSQTVQAIQPAAEPAPAALPTATEA